LRIVCAPATLWQVDWFVGASLEDAEIERLAGGPARVTIESILSHPRMPEAHAHYLGQFLGVYGGDPFLVRLLIESGRFFVHLLALVIEAGHDPARRETWPTVGLLKEKMAMFGYASDRHIDQLIARLCEVGYLDLVPSVEDRRVRILRTTERMRAHDMDWRAANYAPLAFLYPEHDYGPVMRRDPEFHLVHRRVGIALLPLGVKLMASLPDTMLYFNRAGGILVIAALLHEALGQDDPAHAAVPYAHLGDRFGLSRTHVRKLLVAAEEAGLVKLHARGGRRVEILPRLWDSHRYGTACGMYINDLGYVMAIRQMSSAATAAA
jgi:hypothetical protein